MKRPTLKKIRTKHIWIKIISDKAIILFVLKKILPTFDPKCIVKNQ